MLFFFFACATRSASTTDTVDSTAFAEPESTPDERVGLAYDVVLSAGTLTMPENCDQLFDTYLDTAVRFTVDEITADRIRFEASAVDAEIEAVPLEGEFDAAPSFVTGPADLAVEAYGYSATLYETTWAGELADDGSAITAGRLDGLLDTAPLAAGFGSDDPGVACDLLASFGATCEVCPTGTPYCLALTLEELSGARVE